MHTRLHGDGRIGQASGRCEHYPCPQPVAVGAAHRLGAIGTCQDALDTACGLYLNDPTAWA
jgi:hypothetical protein